MTASLTQKLQLKPGMILDVKNSPADWNIRLPKDLAGNTVNFTPEGKSTALLIFVKNKQQVEQFVLPVISDLNPNCLFWLAYPKGTSGVKTDINRDILWKLIEKVGWGPSRMVALDEVWSAMRFHHIDAAKKMPFENYSQY